QRLTETYPDEMFETACAKADDTLATAARSISEIITDDGYINLDFNDVDTTLRDGGTAIISIGYGEGENRVTKAIEDALNSPLLNNTDVLTSKRLLFNLCYSRKAQNSFKTAEASEFNKFVSKIDQQVEVIWGIHYDESLGEKVKLTVLAAGFDITVKENDKGDPEIVLAADHGAPRDNEPAAIDTDKISKMYGDEKIGETMRVQDRQRYIIFDDDNLDDDQVIERFEKTPAYNRDRREAQNLRAAERPVSAQTPAPKTSAPADPNQINFIDEE
ncbi:MAG: cell division protein FtsZ, partial [Muribaculaceae bacterium]|nr:cell division protein FtsZ [Muribaculaceae bacterium]